MSWDERIFGAIFRTLQRARAPKRSPEAVARTATLASMRPRLAVIAAACAGRAVEIVAAEGVGGVRGAAIALPEEIDVAPSIELNEAAYVYRAIYSATSARLGFSAPDGATPGERALATLLAAPPTIDVIVNDFHGFARLHETLAASARASRPRVDGPIEALAQRLLGRPWVEIEAEAPPSAVALARRAEGLGVRDQGDLARAVERLGPSMGAAPPPVVLWGELAPRASVTSIASPEVAPGASGTERRGKPKDHVRRVDLGDEELEENPLVHSFEKVHTLEEHKGGKKRMDGADDLAEHEDALDELDVREVVRSRERARSLLRVDAMIEGAAGDLAGELGDEGLAYDEWDERARSYKRGFCRVFVSTARRAKDREAVAAGVREVLARHRAQTRALREKLQRIPAARAFRGRQPDGGDVDVDAIVDWHAAFVAGRSGSDKLYVSRRPHAPSLAILILVDMSLSTDAWVLGRRVLDVAKESILVLGDVLTIALGEVGVAAFHSNTRRDCRFVVVKGFSEPWDRVPARLATIEPEGYTRIGPALRHATTLLDRCQSRRKLILLVSDGKPTDYDRYEGRHGIADVRRAVREASQKGVHTFGLAIEREATPHLAQMFGKDGYEILPRPDALADALTRLAADLAA